MPREEICATILYYFSARYNRRGKSALSERKNDFSKGSIPRNILMLAAPMTLAQLINVLYSVVDRMYLGRLPGHLALTGLGLTMPIVSILMGFANLCGMGGAPLCSICRGQGDDEEAEHILGNSFTLLLILGAAATLVFLLLKRPVLYLFGASEATFPYADAYLTVYLCGTLFVMVSLGMNPFITTQGFAKTSMLSVLVGAASNIILDPIFIFALHMGVRGAALATIVSQALSCTWVLHFLMGKKSYLKIHRCNMKLKKDIILPSLALGLSTFIMQSSESIISVCFNSSLLKYGGDLSVGAMTILTSAMQFALLPLQGLGQGAQPIISYNYGAGQTKRVKDSFKLLLKIDLSYSTLMWLLVMLFPAGFASIFTSDQALLTFTAHALRIYMASILLFGIQMACQMTFTSIGNAKASIIVAVTRKFILLLPLIYIMPHIFTADQTSAVYMAEPIADFLAICFTSILFRFEFKKALAR